MFHTDVWRGVYAAQERQDMLIVLVGGTKRRQADDIERAQRVWQEWRERHDN